MSAFFLIAVLLLSAAAAQSCGDPVDFFVDDVTCGGAPANTFVGTGGSCFDTFFDSFRYSSCSNGNAALTSYEDSGCSGKQTSAVCGATCAQVFPMLFGKTFSCRIRGPAPTAAPPPPPPPPPPQSCATVNVYNTGDCSGGVYTSVTSDQSCRSGDSIFVSFKHDTGNACSASSNQVTLYQDQQCSRSPTQLTCTGTCAQIPGTFGLASFSCKTAPPPSPGPVPVTAANGAPVTGPGGVPVTAPGVPAAASPMAATPLLTALGCLLSYLF